MPEKVSILYAVIPIAFFFIVYTIYGIITDRKEKRLNEQLNRYNRSHNEEFDIHT
jgi:hypothetical protein